jgi:hypothetical protein
MFLLFIWNNWYAAIAGPNQKEGSLSMPISLGYRQVLGLFPLLSIEDLPYKQHIGRKMRQNHARMLMPHVCFTRCKCCICALSYRTELACPGGFQVL